MENEFHIKEERVKAQQSTSAKTHDKDKDKDKDPTDTTTGKEDKSSSSAPATTKVKIKTEPGTDTKTNSTTPSSGSGKEASGKTSASVAKSKSSSTHEVSSIKKEPLESASAATGGKKVSTAGEKREKGARKSAGKDDSGAPCWDVAPPSETASIPPAQPVSGTSTPSSSSTSGEKLVGRHSSPSVHNGPTGTGVGAPSPKRKQIKTESPDPGNERGVKTRCR